MNMIAIYMQQGVNLDYKNSGDTAIAANTVISLGTRIGIAGTDIPAGGTGTVVTEGVFELKKTTGSIDLGAVVYYDASADNVTTSSSGNVPAGYAIAAAKENDATVAVKLVG